MMPDELVNYSREVPESPTRPEALAVASLSAPAERKPDRLIREIERQVREGRGRAEGRTETWTRSPITENIEIAVQGIDPKEADLVEELARKIKKLLGTE